MIVEFGWYIRVLNMVLHLNLNIPLVGAPNFQKTKRLADDDHDVLGTSIIHK